jgi:hypothetical protein
MKGGLTMRETPGVGTVWQPRQPPVTPHDEHDNTQPIGIISSHDPQSGGPRNPRVSWFKKYEADGVRSTPDFIEIGDPQG